jgi:hypothetical protein
VNALDRSVSSQITSAARCGGAGAGASHDLSGQMLHIDGGEPLTLT